LTLALWQCHIYHCFIYLFIYLLLLNAAQRESLSPSGPKTQSLDDKFSSLGDIYITQL